MSEYSSQKDLYGDLYQTEKYRSKLSDHKILAGNQFKNKKVLVLGIGTGRDVWDLAKDNSVIGLDNSSNLRKLLNKHNIKLNSYKLLKKLPFKANSFDLIIAKDILEHIEYPFEICQEIYRILKPTGYAVINVPNHFFIIMRLKYLFGGNLIWKTPGINHEILFDEWNYMHIKYFTWKGFSKMLFKARLNISKTFFDIGTLNHYTDPLIILDYYSSHKYYSYIKIAVKIFNMVFPISMRRYIASLNPNLLSGSFYVWVTKV